MILLAIKIPPATLLCFILFDTKHKQELIYMFINSQMQYNIKITKSQDNSEICIRISSAKVYADKHGGKT